MPLQRLDNLVRTGQLKAEPPARAEIEGLIHSGSARIKDAENATLSLESRFDLAYNAAHALSLAALRFHGYRSDKRYLVFQALQDTLQLPQAQWRYSIRLTSGAIVRNTKAASISNKASSSQ
jgi:hypothetical protein